VQVAAAEGSVGLGQDRRLVGLALEFFGDPHELPRVVTLGGCEQRRLRLAHRRAADVLRGAGHDRHMLVADIAALEGLRRLRQLLQLPRNGKPLHRRRAGELAMGAQPGDHVECAVSGPGARLLEATDHLGRESLGAIDELAELDCHRPQVFVTLARQPGRKRLEPAPHQVKRTVSPVV